MAHIHEKVDFCVEVFIVYKNTVLLRQHDKYKIWLSIGGHIELGEDPNEAALREVKEEVGLDVQLWSGYAYPVQGNEQVKVLIPPMHINRHSVSPTHEHISMVYFATTKSSDVRPREGERTDGWKWFTKADVQATDLQINIKDCALLALEKLGEK